MNIHDRQAAARSGYDYGVVHIKYVVTSTANQSGLVTLIFDLESSVQVTCDVGYLGANFDLPRPLCSRGTPDVRDRQTSDVRQKYRLMPPPIRGGGIITRAVTTQSLSGTFFSASPKPRITH